MLAGALPYPQQQPQYPIPPSPVETVQGPAISTDKLPLSQAPSASQRSAIAIELPSAKKFNKSEYAVVSDEPDEPANLSLKKRKREEFDGDEI
jgi:cohesin loading factor subunit SCC2